MDIVHIVPGWDARLGGAVAYFRQVSLRLASETHRVRVLTTNAGEGEYFWDPTADHHKAGRIQDDNVEVWRFAARHLSVNHWKLARALALLMPQAWGPHFDPPTPWVPDMHRYVRNMEDMPQLVHGRCFPMDSPLWAGRNLAKRADCPFLITPLLHFGRGEADLSQTKRFYMRPHQKRMLKQASTVFVLTETEAEWAVRAGARPETVCVTGIGVDPDRLTGGDDAAFRQRHRIRGDIVLHIATRCAAKGSQTVVEAAIKLWNNGYRFSLVMAGPTIDEFEDYIGSHDELPERRFFDLGYVSEQEKRDAFAAADVFVMPSRADAFGMVYLEAWVNRVPVIGARAGGVPDVIDDGINGYIVEYGAAGALADRIKYLLKHPENAREMGEAGRRKTLKNYTWDKAYGKILNRYRTVLDGSFGSVPEVSE